LCFFLYRAPPVFYTLSLHDALPISAGPLSEKRCFMSGRALAAASAWLVCFACGCSPEDPDEAAPRIFDDGKADDVGASDGRAYQDRKSTRLNSSHVAISYAVFCLKK